MMPGAWADGQAILRHAEELEKSLDDNKLDKSPFITNPELNSAITSNSLRSTANIMKRNAP